MIVFWMCLRIRNKTFSIAEAFMKLKIAFFGHFDMFFGIFLILPLYQRFCNDLYHYIFHSNTHFKAIPINIFMKKLFSDDIHDDFGSFLMNSRTISAFFSCTTFLGRPVRKFPKPFFIIRWVSVNVLPILKQNFMFALCSMLIFRPTQQKYCLHPNVIKKNTWKTWQRDRKSSGKIFRQMAPLESAQFETYSNFWIAPCISAHRVWKLSWKFSFILNKKNKCFADTFKNTNKEPHQKKSFSKVIN